MADRMIDIKNITQADIVALDADIEHLVDMLGDPKKDWGCEDCKQDHIRLLRWIKMLRGVIK